MKPLSTYPPLHGRDIEYESYDNWQKLDNQLERFEDNCPFDTIALDSLTSLARMTITYLFNNRGNTSGSVKRKAGEDGFAKVGNIPIMDLAEYNGEASGLSQILTRLRVIFNKNKPRVNVILTAHVITTESPLAGGGVKIHRRLVTGGNKIAAEVPGYFDEVYHFHSDKENSLDDSAPNRYFAITESDEVDFAGTSFHGLPRKIDFTNGLFYNELMSAIQNPIERL
jgi:hypothetical protein